MGDYQCKAVCALNNRDIDSCNSDRFQILQFETHWTTVTLHKTILTALSRSEDYRF